MTVPARIGPYAIVRRLGVGGMAEVFLARAVGASGFEKLVAIKVLREERRGDPIFERSLIEEAKLGARLSHPNLVQVHELGVDRGVYWVRLDFVDGADLYALHRRGTLTLPLILRIASDIALALLHVHGLTDAWDRPLGLVHRDVSPSNVLLSKSGEVKLADFGIAKATMLADGTAAGIRRGKYAYMSPEQLAAAPLTPQSDQFGFGVMLYELITGTRPFDGANVAETMDRIREASPPDISAIDPDLGAIITRCVKREPHERFARGKETWRAASVASRANLRGNN
jgi:eukaryotic-like serine/threonine-protein kinase